MRKRTHELLGLSPEYREGVTPEYPKLSDEFNRDLKVAEEETTGTSNRDRLTKVMLLLGAAGLTVIGVLFSHTTSRMSVVPTATLTAIVTDAPTETPRQVAVWTETPAPPATLEPTRVPAPEPTATPTPTAEPTTEPTATPEPTPELYPIRKEGAISITVYADRFDYSDWSPVVLANETFREPDFTEYRLPPLPYEEGFTAVGRISAATPRMAPMLKMQLP